MGRRPPTIDLEAIYPPIGCSLCAAFGGQGLVSVHFVQDDPAAWPRAYPASVVCVCRETRPEVAEDGLVTLRRYLGAWRGPCQARHRALVDDSGQTTYETGITGHDARRFYDAARWLARRVATERGIPVTGGPDADR